MSITDLLFRLLPKGKRGRMGLLLCLDLLIAALAGMAVLAILLGPELFSIVHISTGMWLYVVIASAVFLVVHCVLFRVVMPKREDKLDERDAAEKLLQKMLNEK